MFPELHPFMSQLTTVQMVLLMFVTVIVGPFLFLALLYVIAAPFKIVSAILGSDGTTGPFSLILLAVVLLLLRGAFAGNPIW